MVRDEYLRYFASVPLFSNCTKGQLQEIGKVADDVDFPAGKVLARQGGVGFELLISSMERRRSRAMDNIRRPSPPATSWENWPSFRVALAMPRLWPRPNCALWF